MERNVVRTTIVAPDGTNLEDKEGYAVRIDGTLTAATGDFVYGIVSRGRPAGEGSVIITGGECEAEVAGPVSAGDPLTGGADGRLAVATIGTHLVRAIAKEAIDGNGKIQVVLI